MQDLQLSQKLIPQILITNSEKRKIAVKESFTWFFYIYFGHYINYQSAPFQEEIKNLLQDGNEKFLEIIAFRGSAKRQPLDARILTPDGFNKMGNLSIGDYVIGSDGKPTKIVNISEIVSRPIYVVETTDGRKTECDAEHLWTVRKTSNVREKYITLTTQDIIKRGLFYDRIDKRDNKKYKEYKFSIDTVKPVHLNKKDLSLNPYLLGILLGDGSFCKKTGFARLHFHREDGEHYRKYLPDYDLSETKYKKEDSNAGRFSVRGIGNIIKKLGLNVNCYNKFIPKNYLYGNIEQRRAILEGLMDTDGTVNSGTPSFTSASEKLTDGVVSLVRSLGGRAKKSKRSNNGFVSWRVSILFTDYIPFRLKRKRQKVVLSKHSFITITNINKKGNKLGRCIMVDSKDGLYVTDDYLLTHNSTMAMLALPIWATISSSAKFPILISDTFGQAKQHIYNLKTELETNKGLIKDWGPFEENEEWTATNIVLPRYGARLLAKSTGQKMRGLRHKQHRPDLFIVDDIENLEMIRTKEQRDKIYRWFLGDVLPSGDKDTRYVLIGNLLHSDAIMARIKKEIESGVRIGKVREFPFFDKEGIPMWKEKFETKEDIKAERGKYDNRTWQREFLLKIIAEEGQIIKDEWVAMDKRYGGIPDGQPFAQGTGIDLAISEKDTADFTSMVSGKVFMEGDKPKLYVLPNPVNEHLSFHSTIEMARAKSLSLGKGSLTDLWVEDVAYQKAAVQEMERVGLPARGVKVSTDKRARLQTIASYVENGTVVFPKKGCEDLILQLTGFGIEKHDDLCDAFVHLVQALMTQILEGPQLFIS